MKTKYYLRSLLNTFFGQAEKVNIQQGQEESIVDEAWKTYCRHLRGGGFLISGAPDHPFTLVDKTTVELLYGNYKASQVLRDAIERFNVNSTVLGKRMLILSVIMTILVLVQACIMIVNWL